jgi:CrcB protein
MAGRARTEWRLDVSEVLKSYFWVAVGSAVGGVGRFWISNIVTTRWSAAQKFPWDIILINISGSFVIGVLAALTMATGRLNTSRGFILQFCMVGICGGYTTFSSFSLHTLRLARDGQWLWAAGNVVISVVACLVAVWLGFALGQVINR